VSSFAKADPLQGHELRAVIGATAVGKSALALALALRYGYELVSLDSMQVYRGMDVGTAKPSAAERAAVRHHMLDLVDPRESYDVARFLGDLQVVLAEMATRGARPLFVGGTGLYLKVLLSGISDGLPSDPAIRAALRARLETEGSARLHGELLRLDPPSALRIHPNDHMRLVRALEIHALTGHAPSALKTEWSQPARPARLLWLDLPLDELESRIRARTEAMFDAGWPNEALDLQVRGLLGPTAGMALGYAEAAACARGEVSRMQAVEAIVLATRQFARRQRTWWRKFPAVCMRPRGVGDGGYVEEAGAALGEG
jgi:tRNA dimethylallyltransferase